MGSSRGAPADRGDVDRQAVLGAELSGELGHQRRGRVVVGEKQPPVPVLGGDELGGAERAAARPLLLGEPHERLLEARALLEVDLPGGEAALDLGEPDASL